MKRVHFPPDGNLTDIQDFVVTPVNVTYSIGKEQCDSSSHLCGKFSSPFRVGVSMAYFYSYKFVFVLMLYSFHRVVVLSFYQKR